LAYIQSIEVASSPKASLAGIARRRVNVAALIGATAEYIGAGLATRNKKHFPMITRLLVPY
jgi:predicted nucleic acid-binding protein